MPIPTFPAIRPPLGVLLHLDERQPGDAREFLFPVVTYDDDGRIEPAVEAFSMRTPVTLNVKVDDFLRSCIDAVASEFGLTRSECTRRLLYAAIGEFPGSFERIEHEDVHSVTPAPANWKNPLLADVEDDDDDRPGMMGDWTLGDDARPEAA